MGPKKKAAHSAEEDTIELRNRDVLQDWSPAADDKQAPASPARKRVASTNKAKATSTSGSNSRKNAKRRSSIAAALESFSDEGPRSVLRFAAVVSISFVISAVGHTLVATYFGPYLSGISRSLNDPEHVAAVVGWKIVELGLGWFAGLDDIDLLSFTFLTHLPQMYLLHRFYLVAFLPLLLHNAVDIVAMMIPTRVLGLRAAHHSPVPSITRDPLVRTTTTLLAAIVYILPLLASLLTWLPVRMAIYFTGLKTLDPAHTASLPGLFAVLFPIGFAARKFLFEPCIHPSAYSNQAIKDWREAELYSPAEASLTETVAHNVLFWRAMHPRARVLLHRMVLLVSWTFLNAAASVLVTLEGTEIGGALEWAAAWASGAVASGLVLGWVGDVW